MSDERRRLAGVTLGIGDDLIQHPGPDPAHLRQHGPVDHADERCVFDELDELIEVVLRKAGKDGGDRTIVFSGDLGRNGQPILAS